MSNINEEEWIDRFVSEVTKFNENHRLSYCQFLIISLLSSENNFDAKHLLEKRLVGEPVADYLKPYFSSITTETYSSAISDLFSRRILQECSAVRSGISLTGLGMVIARDLPK